MDSGRVVGTELSSLVDEATRATNIANRRG